MQGEGEGDSWGGVEVTTLLEQTNKKEHKEHCQLPQEELSKSD